MGTSSVRIFDIKTLIERRHCNEYARIKAAFYQGEKVDIECKKAESSIPKSVYESYFAFANTKGGYIIFGVKEDRMKKIRQKDL